MGKLALKRSKGAALLPKWKSSRHGGLRVIFNTPQTMAHLSDRYHRWFWAAAEKAELPVMCCASATAAFGKKVAEKHPGLQLILDHMGVSAALVREKQDQRGISPRRSG